MIMAVDRIMAFVSAVLALLAGALIAVILALMVTDVMQRNMNGRSVAGAFEVITMMLVGVVFLGLAHAERTESTIKLTLVTSRLRPRAALATRLASNGLTLVMSGWLAWATWEAAQRSIERGEYQQGLLSIPIWPAKLVIALGFGVLTIEIALTMRRIWIRAREDQANPPALTETVEPSLGPRTSANTRLDEVRREH